MPRLPCARPARTAPPETPGGRPAPRQTLPPAVRGGWAGCPEDPSPEPTSKPTRLVSCVSVRVHTCARVHVCRLGCPRRRVGVAAGTVFCVRPPLPPGLTVTVPSSFRGEERRGHRRCAESGTVSGHVLPARRRNPAPQGRTRTLHAVRPPRPAPPSCRPRDTATQGLESRQPPLNAGRTLLKIKNHSAVTFLLLCQTAKEEKETSPAPLSAMLALVEGSGARNERAGIPGNRPGIGRHQSERREIKAFYLGCLAAGASMGGFPPAGSDGAGLPVSFAHGPHTMDGFLPRYLSYPDCR